MPLKALKRKVHQLESDPAAGTPAKGIKAEAVKGEVKQEPGAAAGQLGKGEKDPQPNPGPGEQPAPAPAEGEQLEATMGLNELIALHRLTKLDKNSNGKKFPVECKYCNCIFEGRNRAKVGQHTSGLEHRRRWSADVYGSSLQPLADVGPIHEAAKSVTKGTCKGLRLKSAFGLKTRLGSSMFPVWEDYVKFANLNKSDGPGGNACHSVTALCNTGDWILRSVNCKKDNVVVASSSSLVCFFIFWFLMVLKIWDASRCSCMTCFFCEPCGSGAHRWR